MTTEPTTSLCRYVNHLDVVLLEHYPVVRRTPKGVWVQIAPGYPKPKLRFVLNDTRKRFAYETEADAKVSFFARKRRQLAILRRQIEDVEASVLALKEGRIADWTASNYQDC